MLSSIGTRRGKQVSHILSNTLPIVWKWDRIAHMVLIKPQVKRWSAQLACPHPLAKERPNVLLRLRKKVLVVNKCDGQNSFLLFLKLQPGGKKKTMGEREKTKNMFPACKWSVTHTLCVTVFIGTFRNTTQMIFGKNVKTLNTCLLFGVGGLSGYLWWRRWFMFLPKKWPTEPRGCCRHLNSEESWKQNTSSL